MHRLEKILGYEIHASKYDLYKEAFIHNSYQNEHKLKNNYQRLEFIGDSILNLAVVLYLFKKYKDKDEGELTQLKIMAVNQKTLYKATKELGLQDLILLGKGEEKTEGRAKETILSDIFESLIGAMYIDKNNMAVINEFLKKTIYKYIDEDDFEDMHDYKTELQEFLQTQEGTSISYKVVREHNKKFYVKVYNNEIELGDGVAGTKKEAEKLAAKEALSKCSK